MTSKISENSTSQNSPKADVASQTREVTWGTPFPQITVIVFSKDRPLQLDGTLRSFFARCQDADRCQTKVLYRASAEYQPLYDALIREYPSVGFVAEHDFRSDLLKLLSVSEAVLFVVDDNMFIRNFTATEMVDALRDHPQAVGFSMRLGRNTTFCYPLNKTQALPSFETVTPQILSYDWTKADCDFNYPLEVSSSVYRTADVLQLLREMPFRNPNTLEGEFAGRAPRFQASHPRLLCFDLSRAFCNPINIVQTVCQNRVGGESDHLPERLAQKFRAGARLDVAIYFNFIPTGCHQEVSLHFIEGNQPPAGPAVSVIIPCYKQAHYLPESVQSVLDQTFTDWELIIVNDGSPDDTSVVAEQLRQRRPARIRLLEKANGGLSSARNAGIRAAQGEYIFLLDADDRIQPTMLEKTKAVLDTRPKVGFAYTHIQHFGDLTTVFPLPDFDRATLISRDNIVCAMSLVRKAAWLQVGGYNEAMREGYEDWDFWIGCVEQGWEGFRIPEPLACYRKSSTSMLSDANQKRERLIATIVSNHPGLYNAQTRAWADDVLRKAAAQAASTSRNAQSLASLRVTYLISSILGVTGGNQTLLRQADELQRRGHDVTIVTYTPKPDWFTFKMRVVQVPAGQAMALHVPPSDVVISTYFMNAHELLAVKAAVKVYYAQGDQFVFADTTLADSPENRRWRELSRESYLLPQVRFVPNSHNLARAVENMTGRKPDGLLPVCTDQTLFRPLQRSLPGSRVRILIVGPDMRGSSAEPLLFKGIQDIHDALLVVTKRHPNFTAVRMSGSPPEIFQRFPCEFYVAPSDEMKTVLFGTADILIYASHYDSCPRPPQEAMASGCAVVCTATPGAMEYCRDGENCLLVPIQSPQAIADATLRLIEDRALRERLVQGGLATARKYPRELEWNELETMLRRFVEEAKNASTPATTSQALQPAQPTQRPKAAAGKPITLPEAALLGDLLAARTALRDKDLVGAWRLGGEAIEQRPFHPSGWIFLSEVANKVGHRSLARRCAQKAVALTPNWKQAKRALSAIGSGPDKPTVALAEPPFREGLPPRLSVCLIAKNEERFLDGCLKSVRGLANQIVLVDTGSTDRTVEIARSHGAEVHFRTWDDDFSAARNAALLHARGDWILILDADEEVSREHHDALKALIVAPNAIAYRLPMVDVGREADGVSQVPRLFRNAPQQFYVSRIHEQVYASLELNREKWSMENLFGDAQLIHHGYQAEVVKSRDKIQRNLRLLEQANEEYPNDVNLLMNLGLELWRSGQQNYGLGYYQQAYTAMLEQPYAQTPPELREVLLTQYASHLLTLQLYQEVISLFHDRAVAPKARTASQHFILGLAHSALQRWEPCVTHLQQCLKLRNQPALTPIHQDIRSATPAHCLAHSLRKLGRKAEAKTAFEQALQDDPLNESARVEFAAFQADEGQIIPALTLLHAGIEQNPKQAKVWEAGGSLSLRQRDTLEFALDWSREALKHLPNHPTLQRQRAETLLLNGHVHEALPLWSEVSQSNEAANSSGLILCRLFAGESQSALPPEREVAVSQDLIRRYRQSVEMGLDGWVNALHQRVGTLRQTLPSAARLIDQVVAESGPEK